MNDWTDRHETLLRGADPARSRDADETLDRAALDRAWQQVVTSMPSSGPRRRPGRTVVAGLAAAALLGLGGTAAADVLSSRTGQYVDREDWQAGGPGEELDPRGEDFRQVVADETTGIPFPSDEARQLSLDAQVADQRRGIEGEPVRVSTSAMAGFVANDAVCSWASTWARATRAGDRPGVQQATDALVGATDWDAVVVLQRLEPERFDWLAGVAQAARGTSVRAMGASLAAEVYCPLALIPDLPEALPPGDPRRADLRGGS
ncbi:hypothetical protein H5V45_00165 [Nocardioides sp. KIGAM211]|uniref:Uncharacterized protein n=1 Tax=Nocardioides luti TaxID=2761101 RepID=A0A7X0RCH7_9ACTN|nr:hypothetical protein [Nocardioides luti]MBB6625720.1 hypothetical protein [Nocardioides luti]